MATATTAEGITYTYATHADSVALLERFMALGAADDEAAPMTAPDDGAYVALTEAAQVTDEVLEVARMYVEGWYNDGPIDWEDVWNRMDGTRLDDGIRLDMGESTSSPAMRKIQRTIRAERREG